MAMPIPCNAGDNDSISGWNLMADQAEDLIAQAITQAGQNNIPLVELVQHGLVKLHLTSCSMCHQPMVDTTIA